MDTINSVVALLTAVVGLVTYFVQRATKARTVGERLAVVQDLARVAVRAAEQRYDEPNSGDKKLTSASLMLSTAAKRLGVKLAPQEVAGFIHAALREMEAIEAMPVEVTEAA